MATRTKTDTTTEIKVDAVELRELEICIVGTTPLILNSMSQKAWQELLAPHQKTAADKAANLKHNPIEEFRNAPYYMLDADAPTLLAALPTWFKQAMGTAALDLPGAKKAQILRLVSVDWDRICLWGVPRLFMSITRSAGQNAAPDVRTRVILERWCCKVRLRYVHPNLREGSIVNLLAAGGVLSGVGDWRQEKGSGGYGAFRLCSPDDAELVHLVANAGRAAQQQAMDDPQCYDSDTQRLLDWFRDEIPRRGFVLDSMGALVSAPEAKPKGRKKAPADELVRSNGKQAQA